jgi:tRNA 2-thiouridine synthesizing protein A
LASGLLKGIANDKRGQRRMSQRPFLKIDLHDSLQPLALLKVNQTLRGMQPGDRMEIHGADPSTFQALMRLFPEARFTVTEAEVQPTGYRIRLTCRSTNITGSDPAGDPPQQKETKMTTDLSSLQVDNTVDARGSACPGPLLEAKKGIGKVKVGQVLEIFSNDSGTRKDIPAWAGKVGHEYLGVLEADGYDKHFVRRKK